MSRHSSGSSRAAISVEPTRSQNSTVRWRRSPSANVVTGGFAARAAGASNAVPHSPQKRSPGWFVAPHLGQPMTSGAPQAAQNLRPSRLSLPHLEQRILLTLVAMVLFSQGWARHGQCPVKCGAADIEEIGHILAAVAFF